MLAEGLSALPGSVPFGPHPLTAARISGIAGVLVASASPAAGRPSAALTFSIAATDLTVPVTGKIGDREDIRADVGAGDDEEPL